MRTLAALLSAGALLATGCGADDEGDVRATLEQYVKAIQSRDYQTICDDIFSQRLIDKLREVNLPCETALQRGFMDVESPTIQVRSVKIEGDSASAVARSDAANQEPSEDTIRLAKEDGRWKIIALSTV
jgi:ketosteroid isomerase-like protein